MAKIEDLIAHIADERLQKAIALEVKALKRTKKFGLVFDEHLPETVRLPRLSVREGELVALKRETGNQLWRVRHIHKGMASCDRAVESRSQSQETGKEFPVAELVVVRSFGDPIYPALVPVDRVAHGGPDKPWHILINADNFHALQLLLYAYEGKVDVVYIDPPYNTGARDWKYNNDYVDDTDPWRHSKWLSFISRRLQIARRLMKPNSVLVVTIDEHEVHHLRCLLEEIFPKAYIQMVTIVTNPGGITQGRFSRVEEYAVFCFLGDAKVSVGHDDFLTAATETLPASSGGEPALESLLRRGTGSRRQDRKSMFYPVVIDPQKGAAVGVGEVLPFDEEPDFNLQINGLPVAWPIRTDLSQGRWRVGAETLKQLIRKGFVRVGKYDEDRKTWSITYVTRTILQQLESGAVQITGYDELTGVARFAYTTDQTRPPRTVWYRNLHNAGPHGSDFLRLVFAEGGKFPFPKSLYSVRDTLLTLLRDKPSALVVDFFAGSGTTLNALSLINAQDGGSRRSILVTNNEVSESEATSLFATGLEPGHPEWDERGICESVTWPRIKWTTAGKRDNGAPLPGEYFAGQYEVQMQPVKFIQCSFADGAELSSQARRDLVRLIPGLPMSAVKANDDYTIVPGGAVTVLWHLAAADRWLDAIEEEDGIASVYVITTDTRGFKRLITDATVRVPGVSTVVEQHLPLANGLNENVEYFRLAFLDPNDVARGDAFKAILPILWMMAGCRGEREDSQGSTLWFISKHSSFAVLIQEKQFRGFREKLTDRQDIEWVFLVTDSEENFALMRRTLGRKYECVQLYKSYLENFRLNTQEALA